MTVNRSQDQAGPAILTIFYTSPHDPATATIPPRPTASITQDTPASSHTPFERTKTINMKHRHESDILSELMGLTKATPVVATPKEAVELQKLVDEEKRAALDRARNAAYTDQKRQEKALLDQARGALGPA